MKVKFLVDFRGRETGEVFYRAGDVADIEPLPARQLIGNGCAIEIEPVIVADEKPVAIPAKGKRK